MKILIEKKEQFKETELTYSLTETAENPEAGKFGQKKLRSRLDIKNTSSSEIVFSLEDYLLKTMTDIVLSHVQTVDLVIPAGDMATAFDEEAAIDAEAGGIFANVEVETVFHTNSTPETGTLIKAVSIEPIRQREVKHMIEGYIPGFTRSANDESDRRGDGLVIRSNYGKGFTLVVDGFDGSSPSKKLIQHLKSKGYKEIYELLSHPHYDHGKGLRMINTDPYFDVRALYCYDPESIAHGIGSSSNGRSVKEDYDYFKAGIAEARKKGADIRYLKTGDKVVLGDIVFEIWRKQPKNFTEDDNGKGYAFVNDGSLCTLFRDLCFLTTGDGPSELKEALAYFKAIVIFFKVPHHGNKCPQSDAVALKDAGCKLAYQTNIEKNGPGTTDFTLYGTRRVRQQKIPVLQQDQDIYFVAADGKLTIRQGDKSWTFDVPYNGKLAEGWYTEPGRWYYIDDKGERAKGWKQCGWSKGTSWFLFDDDGYMLTGWQCYEGTWYYLDPKDGYMWINKAVNTDGSWYFVDEYGRMRTGWYTEPGIGLHYLEPERVKNQGHMYINATAEIDGKTYSFDGYGIATEITAAKPEIKQNSSFTGKNTGSPREPVKYIVIHYTGNDGATAYDNVQYFNNGDRGSSADFFIGFDGEIWQYNTLLNTRYSWHCGGDIESSHHPLRGICTNRNSIGVELCTRYKDGKWIFEEKTTKAAAALVSWLMSQYNVPIDRVCRHWDVTGKACPRVSGWGAVGGSAEWDAWLKTLGGSVPAPVKSDNEKFIDTIGALAQADMKKTGILASLTMAQAILESGWGKSELAVNAKNLFGMKCNLSGNTWPGSTWDGKSAYNKATGEVYNGSYVTIKADFRSYKSWAESVGDHGAYLAGAMNGSAKRYAGLVGCTDYKKAAQIVKSGEYATSTDYVSKLVNLIETYKLYAYDGVTVNAGTSQAPAASTQKGWNELMPELKRGSSGKAVKMLQAFLGGLTVDGDYGAKTEKAVKAFQKATGLSQDGVVGPKTWNKIIQSL